MNAQDAPLVASRPSLFPPVIPALLALADGTVFRGRSIGAIGRTVGEVVFNTAMTGYQEILTDPSYEGQIVTLTYPHIGNVGVNREDAESKRVHRGGPRDPRPAAVDARTCARTSDLSDVPRSRANVVGIADIDTRKLTRILRDKGAQNGCIVAGGVIDDAAAPMLSRARRPRRRWRGSTWRRSCPAKRRTSGRRRPGRSARASEQQATPRYHVVAYDYGVKHNILRMLAERGCRLTVVPAQTPRSDVLAMKPDGVFLSNGPGDPEPCDYAIAAIREIVGAGRAHVRHLPRPPAARPRLRRADPQDEDRPPRRESPGAGQGHRPGADHQPEPRLRRRSRVASVERARRRTSRCSTARNQGIARTDKPAFSFQGHPEASPGPHDIGSLFDRFVHLMEKK